MVPNELFFKIFYIQNNQYRADIFFYSTCSNIVIKCNNDNKINILLPIQNSLLFLIFIEIVNYFSVILIN